MSTFGSSTSLLGSAAAGHSPMAQAAELQAEVLALYDALQGRLLRYAMSFGLSKHDGEDVLQEVFLALFRHLQMGRPQDNLPGWTYRTTHNLALKRRASLHAEWREPATDDLVDCYRDDAPGPEEDLLFRERQQRLRSVLRVLPENDQVCLRLRAEGCRYREIAAHRRHLARIGCCVPGALVRAPAQDGRAMSLFSRNTHLADATLLLLIEGDLQGRTLHKAEQHLATCSKCGMRRFALIEASVRVSAGQPKVSATSAARDRLAARLTQEVEARGLGTPAPSAAAADVADIHAVAGCRGDRADGAGGCVAAV